MSFYFISFINPHPLLTDIVIVHIFYINETIPPPIHDCDAVGGAFYYLGIECDPLPEAGSKFLGANATPYRRQANIVPNKALSLSLSIL